MDIFVFIVIPVEVGLGEDAVVRLEKFDACVAVTVIGNRERVESPAVFGDNFESVIPDAVVSAAVVFIAVSVTVRRSDAEEKFLGCLAPVGKRDASYD